MMDYARQRAEDFLRIPRKAVLVTSGPAGVQASECPCEALGLELYLLAPRTSDHLFNLEHEPEVTVLSELWEIKGRAQVMAERPGLELQQQPDAAWCELVRVSVKTLQVRRDAGWGYRETIEV